MHNIQKRDKKCINAGSDVKSCKKSCKFFDFKRKNPRAWNTADSMMSCHFGILLARRAESMSFSLHRQPTGGKGTEMKKNLTNSNRNSNKTNMNSHKGGKGTTMKQGKKVTNIDRKNIMKTAHTICNHGKAMAWAGALRKAWQAWKENSLETLTDVREYFMQEFNRIMLNVADDGNYYQSKILNQIAYNRLANIVKNTKSEQDSDGKQVDNELSVSAQKAFYHYGFFGFNEESYRDYLQNIALATCQLIRKDGYIENKIEYRKENGLTDLTIEKLLWYGSLIGWNLTVKSIVHRMRKSAKNHEYEYFNVDSLDKTATNTDGDSYNPYDEISADSVKGQYGFSDKTSRFETLDAIYSACSDEQDFAIVTYRQHGHTQTETAEFMQISQQAIAERLKKIAKRYHKSIM